MFVYKVVVTTLDVLLGLSLARVLISDRNNEVRTGIFIMAAVLLATMLGMWG